VSKKKMGQSQNFSGRGILRCLICDEPYTEHPIRPCEQLNMDVIYVPARKRKRSTYDRRKG